MELGSEQIDVFVGLDNNKLLFEIMNLSGTWQQLKLFSSDIIVN